MPSLLVRAVRAGGGRPPTRRHRIKSDAEKYLASAIGAIFGPSKRGLWAMMTVNIEATVHIDASGTHDGSPVFMVAGLVSTPLRWERLSNAWRRTLEKEGLEDFHMTDCATGGGSFSDRDRWPTERRNSLVKRLTNIVNRHVMARTWSAVAMADYRMYVPGERTFPYGICAAGCASRLCAYSTEFRSQPFISYVFDQGDLGGSAAFQAFDEVRGGSNVHRMGMISKGDRRLCLPLQAADLHAWEVRKYFADQLQGTGLGPRGSFMQLLSIREAGGGGYFFCGASLGTLLKGIDEGQLFIQIPIYQLNRQTLLRVTLHDQPQPHSVSK
jgi:hypothetical protein